MTKATHKIKSHYKNTEIVFEYLEKFPEAPSKTLGRKIYAEMLHFLKTLNKLILE